jgi:hypothetical protein
MMLTPHGCGICEHGFGELPLLNNGSVSVYPHEMFWYVLRPTQDPPVFLESCSARPECPMAMRGKGQKGARANLPIHDL